MINLLIALAIAAAVTAATAVSAAWMGVNWYGALGLGAVVLVVAYLWRTRRTGTKVSEAMAEVQRHAQAGRGKRAIAELEKLRPFARWQFMLGRSLDAQIGSFKYAQDRDFAGARPYLERAPRGAWHAQAMLAADHYRRKRYDDMARVFERALKRNRKTSLLYAAYAWCEWKRRERASAIDILSRGLEKLPKDERLQKNLQALQNHKKMRMRGYGAEWYALHLEAPPRMTQKRPPKHVG